MKNSRGFTLLEMLIIIIIVSILSIVGKGTYDRSVERSKFTEAYSFVYTIINAQKDFFTLNNRFAENLDELGIDFSGMVKEVDSDGEQWYKTKNFKYSTGLISKDSVDDMAFVHVVRIPANRRIPTFGAGFRIHYFFIDFSWWENGAKYTDTPAGSFFTTSYWHINPHLIPTQLSGREMDRLDKHFDLKFWS